MSIAEHNPWKVLHKQEVYRSPWITVEHHDVLNPAGNPGTYSVVHFDKLAIGVIPLDEEGYTWLVGQYRYPLDLYTWEIPEGGGDRNTDPVESARRELLEECGIIANDIRLIQEMQLSNSATDEIAYLFLATDLSYTEAMPEETELLQVKKVHFDEAFQMVLDGTIKDSLSVAAILKLKWMLQEKQSTM